MRRGQQVVEATRKARPGTDSTQGITRADNGMGYAVEIIANTIADTIDGQTYPIARKTNAATEVISGVALEYQDANSVRIGTKGLYWVRATSGTAAADQGLGIIPTTTAGVVDHGAARTIANIANGSAGVGVIMEVDTTNNMYLVDLNLP